MGFIMDLSRFKWLQKPWDSSSSLFLKPVLSLPSIPFLWLSHDSVICNTLRYTLQHKLHLHNFTQWFLSVPFYLHWPPPPRIALLWLLFVTFMSDNMTISILNLSHLQTAKQFDTAARLRWTLSPLNQSYTGLCVLKQLFSDREPLGRTLS